MLNAYQKKYRHGAFTGSDGCFETSWFQMLGTSMFRTMTEGTEAESQGIDEGNDDDM